ncbi:hypothetical protein [Pantoea sp. 18069]|uniref:hypothetical protein n=1 Tax=Pantoea sp. 18069 TaxID=2681415 RepID=UPI00135CA8AD|nr:hypothetical protein [Pantoea sp. 18069]
MPLSAPLPSLLALHCRLARLRTSGVLRRTAWPAAAARLRERDAARLNIGPRQAARARRAGLRGTGRRMLSTGGVTLPV